ncbi:NHL repeat-containing protein [Pedococcus soli]
MEHTVHPRAGWLRSPAPLLTALAAVLGLLVAAAAPAGAARTSLVPLPDGLRPEGITAGPGDTYYVGSLADGRIVTGDLSRRTNRVLLPGAEGRQIRGLDRDDRTGLVWAAGNVGSVAHVWAVDSRTGRVASDTVVPGGVFLNDLVVTRDAVWVTDSRVDRLTVIALGRHAQPTGAAAAFLPLRGAWPAGDGVANNANGIRQLSDGSAVLNNSRVGGLWRVDPRTGVTTSIPVRGGPAITGGDGLELSGRTLYNVRGTGQAEVSVVRLEQSRHGWSARYQRTLTDASLDVPSTAVLVGGTLWAVNARFGVANPDTAPYWITPLRAHRG